MKLIMFGSHLCYCMNQNSCVFYYIYMWRARPETPVIYSIQFLFLNFLGSDIMLYPHVQGFPKWVEHEGSVPSLFSPILLILPPCNGLSPSLWALHLYILVYFPPHLSGSPPPLGQVCSFLHHSMKRGANLLLENYPLLENENILTIPGQPGFLKKKISH